MLLTKVLLRLPRRVSALASSFLIAGTCFMLSSAVARSPAEASTGEESPYEVLAELPQTYQALSLYQDQGTIEIESPGQPRRRIDFLSRKDASGAFVFRLQPNQPDERAFWRREGKAFAWDAADGGEKEVVSLAAEVLLSLGEGGQDSLLVPSWLLGSGEGFESPDAASVERQVCGQGSCQVVTFTRQGGALESELWVDAKTGLLQLVEVRIFRGPEAMPLPGRSQSGEPKLKRSLKVYFDRVSTGAEVSESAHFSPREHGYQSLPDGEGEAPVFGEEISVSLLTYRVRVLASDGGPVRGLLPENFSVRLRGQDLEVVAADWVEAGSPLQADLPPEALAELDIFVPPPGRLMVLFVQAGFEPTRMLGHLKQTKEAKRFLKTLQPDDRVAVVSFDSHLKLRLDFTKDMDRVEEVLGEAVRFGSKADPIGKNGLYPSLARHFDFREAKRAAYPERGLELTAKAMKPLLGERVMVFMGWGVGEYSGGGVRFSRAYDRAVAAFADAGISVSVLDISEADFHTLELGLQQIASDTGGTYERRFRRGGLAMDHLMRSLDGYYRLIFRNPDPQQPHNPKGLRIRLEGAKGRLTHSPVPLPE